MAPQAAGAYAVVAPEDATYNPTVTAAPPPHTHTPHPPPLPPFPLPRPVQGRAAAASLLRSAHRHPRAAAPQHHPPSGCAWGTGVMWCGRWGWGAGAHCSTTAPPARRRQSASRGVRNRVTLAAACCVGAGRRGWGAGAHCSTTAPPARRRVWGHGLVPHAQDSCVSTRHQSHITML